jgi:hypothetical protein
MKEPNFFILGAPKCGTTSLANWLGEHPQVFLPRIKEPFFFNTDHGHRGVKEWRDYRDLFVSAGPEHRAIGEASVFYLYSDVAVQQIEGRFDEPKYIVAVRNPSDMAPSLHEQLLFTNDEHVEEFERAWQLSDQRLEGTGVTRLCREPKILAYKTICCLGSQLQRLVRTVPAGRVLVVVLDDIKADPRAEYLKILDFLGVDDDGRTAFPVRNVAKERRWPGMGRATKFLHRVRRKLPIPRLGINLISKLDAVNRTDRPRIPLEPSFHRELKRFFREDVRLLGDILERDLSSWTDS